MISLKRISTVAVTLSLAATAQAAAQDSGGLFGWVRGDWYLTVGAAGFVAPRFDGDDSYLFNVSPMISLGKAGRKHASPRATTTFPSRCSTMAGFVRASPAS